MTRNTLNSIRGRMCGGWVPAVLTVIGLGIGSGGGPALAETRLLAFGDSLTHGYGLAAGSEFPVVLERALRKEGLDVTVINAGVSGDTSSGGLARIGWSLADNPDLVIVELGANDALRGIDPGLTERNLDQIISEFKAGNVTVLLAGMLAPPNLGEEYGAEFNSLYPRLAEKHNVAFFPFFLQDVAAVPALNQNDYMHPNAAGVEVIVANILPLVMQTLDAMGVIRARE